MNTFFQDLRFGIRMLRKTPGFTTIAVLVLALAIGGTAAMFTIIDTLVFRPLPVKKPEELARLFGKEKKPEGGYRSFSYPNYLELREKNTVFTDLMAFTESMVGVNEGEVTRRSFAALVSTNYFDAFGVRLAAGRTFLAEEEKPGSAVPVVIVSHTYWKKTGSDPGMVGKTIRINSRVFQVIGIGPQYFTGTTALFSPEFWFPLGMYEALANDFTNDRKLRLEERKHHCLKLVGRLKPGVTSMAAQAPLEALATQLEKAYPEANEHYTIQLGKLSRLSVNTYPHEDPSSATLSVLVMGMSGAVLLIACLNLANMLLARSAARKKEIAIRLSLGGGRFRLVRQLLTEGMLLSLVGGAGGLLLSIWGSQVLMASLAPKLPFLTLVFDARPDWRILLATFSACLVSVLLFGLGPAWRLSRVNVTGELKEQVGDELHGKVNKNLFSPRSLLVVGQLALSLALLTAAGLFARSALSATQANPGFSLDKSILVETDASLAGYDETKGRQTYLSLLEKLRGLPGVRAASLAYVVPFGLFSDGRTIQKPGAKSSPDKKSGNGEQNVYASFNIVSADYFKTLGLNFLRGRDFDPLEVSATSAPRVAIIDEVLAKQLFPTADALGQRIQFSEKEGSMEIVGIVPAVRDNMNDKILNSHVYVPFGQEYRSGVNIHLSIANEGRAAEAAMLRTVRDVIRAADPQLAVMSIQTLRNFHEDGMMLWFVKTAARLFAIFGGLALFLAVVGVYGVKSYVVSRRTREIGIRIALGATARNVLWMVLREGLSLTALGLGVGLVLAVAIGFLVRNSLYGVNAIDPFAFTIAPLCLAVAALIACYLPARRATRIQPMAALRYE